MLMADDRRGEQKLHFRGQFIKSVYCLLCPPCRASGIPSAGRDTCLETHLLSPQPLQHREEKAGAVTRLTGTEIRVRTPFAPTPRTGPSWQFHRSPGRAAARAARDAASSGASRRQGRAEQACAERGTAPHSGHTPVMLSRHNHPSGVSHTASRFCPLRVSQPRAAPLTAHPNAPSWAPGGSGQLPALPRQQARPRNPLSELSLP